MGNLNPHDVNRLPDGMHADGDGLYLQVYGDARSWILRYSINGKRRQLGLGSAKDVGLNDARLKAAIKRQVIDDARKGERGAIDPVEERRQTRATSKIETTTFKQAAEEYMRRNDSLWTSPKHSQQWANTLATYVYPVFGNIHVNQVTRQQVLQALRPIWCAKAETARRLRGRIETIFVFAEANEWRTQANPATQKVIAMALGDQNASHRAQPALPHARMAEFMSDLRNRDGMAPKALYFQILTTTRGGEAVGARWSEVDWDNATWCVPKERMKGRRERRRDHVVPLSAPAVALLRELYERRAGDEIFGITVGALERAIHLVNGARARQGLSQYVDPEQDDRPVVPHGVARASFRTWAAECTAFPREVAEKALAHIVGNETERAYNRGGLLEKRRALMDAWAAHCVPAKDGNVISLSASPRRRGVARSARST